MTNSKDNKTKAPNVPPLRFPEFTDEWVEITIQNLATVLGGGTPDTTNKSYWDGNIQWFTPSEIGKNKYVNTSLRTITEDGLNNSSAKLLPPHTILLSSRATVGECSLTLQECATNQGFQSLIAKNCDTDFLYYLIQTKKKELIKKSCGSTFLEISANEVRKIKVAIPTKEEQLKISLLLSLLDERIATQNKIIDNLQSLIKGLAKVLTLQGEPNTRISDCLECHTSTLQESNLQESGKYPAYGASGIAGYLDAYTCDEYSILIIKDGSGVGTVSHVSGKYSVIGTMNNLTAKPGYSLNYLYFCLMNFNFEPFKTGMAIPHIYFKDYGRAKIWCPSLESQNDIAKILSAIEEKLQIESGILDSLHRKKSYLLNNMFI